jgi:hypothetical protein
MQIMEVITIPKKLNKQQREVIAEEIVDFIRDRTFGGYDKNNNKFPDYSEQYANKKGVGEDEVDLVLSGELMDKLKVLKHKQGQIIIGYDGRSKKLNAKAEGNILGSYGRDPDSSKARDFLGISKADLMSIIDVYTGEEDGE